MTDNKTVSFGTALKAARRQIYTTGQNAWHVLVVCDPSYLSSRLHDEALKIINASSLKIERVDPNVIATQFDGKFTFLSLAVILSLHNEPAYDHIIVVDGEAGRIAENLPAITKLFRPTHTPETRVLQYVSL